MRQFARPPQLRRHGGHSRLEMVVSIIVVAILAGLLLQRLVFYQAQAERVAVQNTVAAMRISLQVKAAALSGARRDDLLAALVEENPIDWLLKPPPNYLGEFSAPDESRFPAGNWYFDRSSKSLIYLLNEGKVVHWDNPDRMIFKVELLRLPSNSAKPSETSGGQTGVVLNQISS